MTDVSRETFEPYVELLLKWNQKINLVSKKCTKEEIWDRHICDSAKLFYSIDRDDTLIDIGSGAGFPGIILSIMGINEVTLIESDERKAAFLLQASKISKNKVIILNKRVEELELKCDILTSRAFASVSKILEICKNISVRKKILLLKGEKATEEIDEALKIWSFKYRIYGNGVVEINYDNSDCKPKRRRG